MFKKKKTSAKQTPQNNPKKVTPLNLPSFCAMECRVKTMPSSDLRGFSKTMDLQKDTSCFKKNISRKTTSRTIKMENSLRPSHLKNILKNIKTIRNNPYNDQSKSKSPASGKSRSTKKLCPKDKSENRLSLKIDHTLRRMEFCEIFVDEQSNLVFPSASTRPHLKNSLSNLSEMDDIDIEEMKRFRSEAQPLQRLKVELKSGDSLQESVAAITIQRAWRKYRTRLLVERYTQNNFSYLFGSNHTMSSVSHNLGTVGHQDDMVIVPSDDFYGETVQQDVRQISNLQEQPSEDEKESLQDKVKTIKLQELQKWNSILMMIQATKNSSQEERQRIFSEIARQSEQNRQQLIQLTGKSKDQKKDTLKRQKAHGKDCTHESHKQSADVKQSKLLRQIPNQKDYLLKNSDLSVLESGKRVKQYDQSESDIEQYNSTKYVQYFNADIFPTAHNLSAHQESPLKSNNPISTRKKEMLLQTLNARSVKLPQYGHFSALSMISAPICQDTSKQEQQSSRIQKSLRRSNSERVLRRTLSEISSFQEDKVNLEMLEEEYLQNYPILIEEGEQNSYQVQLPPDFSSQLKQQQRLKSPDEVSKQENDIDRQFQELFDNLVKIEHQDPNEALLSAQKVLMNQKHEENLEKADNLATIIISKLAMQVLHDISQSTMLIASLKRYSYSLKPKVRRTSEGQKKKKGFPTDKKQIDLFLQNFTNYLIRQQMNILNNLQIATGPSALEMLRYMHTEDDESLSEKSESQEPNIMVIPNRIFDAFWKIKEKSIIVEVPPNFTEDHSEIFRQNIEYLKSFNKIFYRSLFDTFNECLDHERNYGILGKPFPWKKSSTFQHALTDQAKKESLERARTKMVGYATTYCGLIIDTEEIGSTVGNEEYLQQVQQDRLSRMLASDLLESEARWQFYDDEEAQILIEISNVIYRELLFEVLEVVCSFQ